MGQISEGKKSPKFKESCNNLLLGSNKIICKMAFSLVAIVHIPIKMLGTSEVHIRSYE